MVVLGEAGSRDPRLTVGETGQFQPPVLGRDVVGSRARRSGDARRQIGDLSDQQPERAQAGALRRSGPAAPQPRPELSKCAGRPLQPRSQRRARPGSLAARCVSSSPGAFPAEKLPADSDFVKYLKIQSRLLSDFHGRPIYLRAGVILPRNFAREPDRRYPLVVHIGGYASRFTDVGQMMSPGSSFQRDWMADDTPADDPRAPGRCRPAG